MKILQAGNANFGYVLARELRKIGIDSDLLISKQIISGKTLSVNNPINLDKSLGGSLPDWVHFYDLDDGNWKYSVIKQMRKYDLVHAYMELPIFAMFSLKPFLAQSGGDDLRDLAFKKSVKGFLLRKAYRKANSFVYVWPPHKTYAEKLGLKNPIYIPRIWDTSSFLMKQNEKPVEGPLTIFHPTSQDWEMKGNDKFLKGFVRLCKENLNVFLYYVDWGKDSKKSKEILDVSYVKDKVKIIPGPISREEMGNYMEISDILADQFNSGSFTRTGIESLVFGIPLLLNLDEVLHKTLHGEAPPVINTQNESDVYTKLKELVNSKNLLKDISKRSQEWGRNHFDLKKNVQRYVEIYEKIL